jgi:AcrR family transcriptional regulator
MFPGVLGDAVLGPRGRSLSNFSAAGVRKEARVASKTDRRVQRTRLLLQQALLALIREKGFEALSVQEIIDRANVGRATFYAHFDNKEDLLLSGLEGLRTSLKDLQRQAHARGGPAEDRLFGFSRELFAHTRDHRDVFQAMVGERGAALVEQVFHRMLAELVRDEVQAMRPRSRSSAAADPVVPFLAGALFGLVMWWLDRPAHPSVDEITSLFRGLAIPAVTAAAR